MLPDMCQHTSRAPRKRRSRPGTWVVGRIRITSRRRRRRGESQKNRSSSRVRVSTSTATLSAPGGRAGRSVAPNGRNGPPGKQTLLRSSGASAVKARPATAGRASICRKNSDGVPAHLLGDVVGLANGKADNRQCWVLGAAGRELATVGDEQILDVMTLAEFVADAVARIF